ncbi:MAG: heparinase, partial [Bacteroidetes bacterium]
GDEKYAIYVRDMLLAYAKMYPELPLHPTKRSYATGKIFWQCLNDANWLVYVSQAYDCIYHFLSEQEREKLEKDLFKPFADFLSIGNPQFFNRIHNHSTWANAAVGMIAIVMEDSVLLNRALYGLQKDNIPEDLRDDDNGFIKLKDQNEAGFLAQLDHSFSPDGYFTEGPYYLRYAIFPFLKFGKALVNNQPELDILAYRDSILKKSVYALLHQTDPNGLFFPINDAQKGMSWRAREVITAVDNIYYHCGQDADLLSIAQLQNRVLLDETGMAVAKAIQSGKAASLKLNSMLFTDGNNGDEGGLAILRSFNENENETCLVMKFTAQGMGHGHFDKLTYALYDETGEVIQDYGSARWVNIDQKGGGRYLPENKTFAKQTVAHNTVTINEVSHFEGKVEKGEKHSPDLHFFKADNKDFLAISARDNHAYPGVEMQRTLALVKDEHFRNPLVIDVFRVSADTEKQMDFPLWFHGHLLSTSATLKTNVSALKPLGEKYGYQHLWHEASGFPDQPFHQMTWFANGKFFTVSSTTEKGDEIILARGGANDPNFNLRHDPVYIHRKSSVKDAIFINIIESHGTYNPVSEIPLSPFATVSSVDILYDSGKYTIVSLSKENGLKWELAIANLNNSETANHSLEANGVIYKWKGPITLIKK